MSKLTKNFCLGLFLAFFWMGGDSQIKDAAAQQQPNYIWFSLPGSARDITSNADGQAYMTGTDGAVSRWDGTEQRWRPMSGKFDRISAAEGNRPWSVNQDGVVYRYNGLWWEEKAKDVLDVAADIHGNVYIAKKDHSIWKWYALRSEWRPIPGQAMRIAIGHDETPWIVAPTGGVSAFDGNGWIPFGGRAVDIAAAAVGEVAISTPEGDIRVLNPTDRSWQIVSGIGNVSTMSLLSDGAIWAVLKNGDILTNKQLAAKTENKEEEGGAKSITAPTITVGQTSANVPVAPTETAPPIVAPTMPGSKSVRKPSSSEGGGSNDGLDPAEITAKGPITFINTQRNASRLAIGKDGTVFALDASGNVLLWSNDKKDFDLFPGKLVRIAVDPEGRPWGISALGRIFRHDGRTWRQILNSAASDIAIGGDGTVLTATSAGALFKFEASQMRFLPIQGNGLRVAVSPDGKSWTIRADKLLQRCDALPCSVFGKRAISLSVGPDGSVWIVSDTQQLMRLRSDQQTFEVFSVQGKKVSEVAVGPSGLPWVVTSDDLVFASSFFERDESDDRVVIASTGGNTVGSGTTDSPLSTNLDGFTFTKNMQFETLNNGDLSNFDSVFMDTGNDGKFYGFNRGGKFTVFQEASKSFVALSTEMGDLNYDLLDFAVEKNGTIWAYIDDMQSQTVGLFREYRRNLQEVEVSGGTIAGVAAAPDDTIYAIFTFPGSQNYLYVKSPKSTVFKRLSAYPKVHDVGVGPVNDIWIVNKDNFVMQWNGSQFEKRPTQGQLASRISVGANGTVYIIDLNSNIRKWNAANKSFDAIKNVTADFVEVDDTGRPWLSVNSTPLLKRAK